MIENIKSTLRLFAAASSMCMALVAMAGPGSVTAESDRRMLTDALGRKAISHDHAGDGD